MGEQRSGDIFNITADTVSTMFRRSVKNCKIIDLTFHDARHEACTRLARKIEVLDLARMIGHRDLRSLMIYYNPMASEIACSDPIQSVDYYLEHLDEAEKVKEKCEVTQGSKDNQNCINADKALYRDYMSSKFSGY